MLGQLANPRNREVSSPSRQYVAMMNRTNFDGHYFRSFQLPPHLANNCEVAAHYYMQQDLIGCMEGCFPLEHYQDFEPFPRHDFSIEVPPGREWGHDF